MSIYTGIALVDDPRQAGLRRRMVKTLEQEGIADVDVLQALFKIPRHYFVESGFSQLVYDLEPKPIGDGQTMSSPLTVAKQTSLLDVKVGEKVLEIGTGSGYQTAVLLQLGAKVVTVERIGPLQDRARAILNLMNFDATFVTGDGSEGVTFMAPYNKILVTCGAPSLPLPLLNQLALGGSIVIPIGSVKNQVMMRYTKTDMGVREEAFGDYSFVPLIGSHGWKVAS
jgi:protein-L-isoaspartate(D-aspartate) O-methyltransferase